MARYKIIMTMEVEEEENWDINKIKEDLFETVSMSNCCPDELRIESEQLD